MWSWAALPCQGFSNLGTRNPDDPRNLLWLEYARVVRLTRPAVFVLENVPQFLKSDQYEMLVDWSKDGPLRGYELTAGVLNAADYGVAQRRRRAIVVGSRRGGPLSPTAFPRQRQPLRPVGDGTRRLCGYPLRDRPHSATGPPVGVRYRRSVQGTRVAPFAETTGNVTSTLRTRTARRGTIRPPRPSPPQLLAEQTDRDRRRDGPEWNGTVRR